MGLEAVKAEILNNAKAQAAGVVAEARKEAGRIAREAEKNIGGMAERSEAETKKTLDLIKRQELASADLENKKMLLEAKKQVIDGVFAEALKRLESMGDRKQEAIIKKLLEKAKSDIEVAHVYCNKKDAKFLKGLNAEHANIAGGIIAENGQKTIRVDYSFEIMLQGIKEAELQNISKVLFG